MTTTYDLARRVTAEADALGNTWRSKYDHQPVIVRT